MDGSTMALVDLIGELRAELKAEQARHQTTEGAWRFQRDEIAKKESELAELRRDYGNLIDERDRLRNEVASLKCGDAK